MDSAFHLFITEFTGESFVRPQVLALDNGHLVGILTPKDLLMRVVSKGLNPDTTPVSAVMTPNPDTVPPEMTVLDALREVSADGYTVASRFDRWLCLACVMFL